MRLGTEECIYLVTDSCSRGRNWSRLVESQKLTSARDSGKWPIDEGNFGINDIYNMCRAVSNGTSELSMRRGEILMAGW